jgi:hypothetical protein
MEEDYQYHKVYATRSKRKKDVKEKPKVKGRVGPLEGSMKLLKSFFGQLFLFIR